MFMEILNALAALATVAGFVVDVAGRLYGRLKGRSARKRMEREEAPEEAPENK